MARRAIFTIYVEIKDIDFDLVTEKYHPLDKLGKSKKSQMGFGMYFDDLVANKSDYAKMVDSDFFFFQHDNHFEEFKNKIQSYQLMTIYNVINFYKFDRLDYLFANFDYDEVLYLDFDVLVGTKDNFFTECDLSTMHVPTSPLNNTLIKKMLNNQGRCGFRAPEAKKLNTNLMLNEYSLDHNPYSYNTGIFAMNRDVWKHLNYFEDFDNILKLMNDLKHDRSFPPEVQYCLGYDNETVFGFRLTQRNLDFIDIDETWHFLVKEQKRDFKFGHFLHKNFDLVL